MESNSEVLRIHCSEAAALLVMKQDPSVKMAFRGKIPVKGKGNMPTYWVEGLLGEGESQGLTGAPGAAEEGGNDRGALQEVSLSEQSATESRVAVPITMSASASLEFDGRVNY